MDTEDTFLLLSIPQVTLTTSTSTYTDVLYLEFVTAPASGTSLFPDRDTYLVLRVSDHEFAIDPSCEISISIQPHARIYIFHTTGAEGRLEVAIPELDTDGLAQDLDTFDHILNQYYAQLPSKGANETAYDVGAKVDAMEVPTPALAGEDGDFEDMRGRLVVIDESDGRIIGELDDQLKIREDPTLNHGLSEDDPVILDLPPDYDSVIASDRLGDTRNVGQPMELPAREIFVRAASPTEQKDELAGVTSLVRYTSFYNNLISSR
jgi:spartin